MLRKAFLPVLSLVIAWLGASAQDVAPLSAADRLKTIADHTNLDMSGVRPWHWKLEVTLYDVDGKNPQQGTVEAWYADGNMRTLLSLGDAHLTTLRLGKKLYRSTGDDPKLRQLEIAFMRTLHPIPDVVLDPAVKLKFASQTLGKIKLECIQPTFTLPSADTFSTDAPLSYCMSPGTDELVVGYEAEKSFAAFDQSGKFSNKQVPVDLQIFTLSKLHAEVKTTELTSFVPTSDIFTVNDSLQPFDSAVELSMKDQIGATLLKEAPHYPASARQNHVSGTVTFGATIDVNGRITSTHVTSNVDASLTEAAMKASKRWIYRPYLVNGIAVPVQTTITIHFNLGS